MKNSARGGKIWIDLDNSPHVPFFVPIIEELERMGHSVFLTTRDAFQVTQLVDLFHLPCKPVGRHYGKHRIMKVVGSCYRAIQLLFATRGESLCLAVSHGSRSQMLASIILRIPSILIMDYEFARQLAVLNPTWVMMPSVISDAALISNKTKILKYPGIKEDAYVPRFQPDPTLKSRLGLIAEHLVVTVRPPANEAHYHKSESDELFRAAIGFLAESPDVRIVVLPRNERQAISIKLLWPELLKSKQLIIPDGVVDGLNLLWFSDFAISGGGTMNREAAALGVPVYSIFRGPIGAVDHYLAGAGRLILLESVEDVRSKIKISRREKPQTIGSFRSDTLATIVENIDSIVRSKHPVEQVAQ
jgi:predicted glycosyltransferase